MKKDMFRLVTLIAIIIGIIVLFIYKNQIFKIYYSNKLIKIDEKLELTFLQSPSFYVETYMNKNDSLQKNIYVLDKSYPIYLLVNKIRLFFEQYSPDLSIEESNDFINIYANKNDCAYNITIKKYHTMRNKKKKITVYIYLYLNKYKILNKFKSLDLPITYIVNPFNDDITKLVKKNRFSDEKIIPYLPITSNTIKTDSMIHIRADDKLILNALIKIKELFKKYNRNDEIFINEIESFLNNANREKIVRLLKESGLNLLYSNRYSYIDFSHFSKKYNISYKRGLVFIDNGYNFEYIMRYLNLVMENLNNIGRKDIIVVGRASELFYRVLYTLKLNRYLDFKY